jgi:hypothetical protein
MRGFKEAVRMYRQDGYIDEDYRCHVLYNDGAVKTFPDEADGIRLQGIKNIWFLTSSDCGDFTHDFICTAEQYDFIFDVVYGGNPAFKPATPLILDETTDYGRIFERGGNP